MTIVRTLFQASAKTLDFSFTRPPWKRGATRILPLAPKNCPECCYESFLCVFPRVPLNRGVAVAITVKTREWRRFLHRRGRTPVPCLNLSEYGLCMVFRSDRLSSHIATKRWVRTGCRGSTPAWGRCPLTPVVLTISLTAIQKKADI
jgi:hypothetical protein